MVRVEKDYVFTGPDGEATLLDLFGRNAQLAARHFMFDPEWEDGCPSCTAAADEVSSGLLEHLHARGTHIVHVARAPFEKIERYRRKRGWEFPFYSSYGSDFNYDFGVTVDHSRGAGTYNYRPLEAEGEYPGTSFFLRQGDEVFHTYSTFARGAEQFGGSYYWLDMTALGRQEEWEEPRGRAAAMRDARPNFTG